MGGLTSCIARMVIYKKFGFLTGLRDWNDEYNATPQGVAALAALKAGDIVQISRNYEDVWVEVESVCGDEVQGSVENTLLDDGKNGDIKRGDMVAFRKCNVGLIDPTAPSAA